MKKSELTSMIREAVKNALGAEREKPEEKHARLQGKQQVLAKFRQSSIEELQRAYLKIETKAEQLYAEPVKHAFLWGALDEIRTLLKRQGAGLPKKNQDPWTR